MSDFIDDAIQAANVELVAKPLEDGNWTCILTSAHGNMVRKLHINAKHGEPKAGNIIYHFALVAQEVSEYDDVLEWSKEEGHDLNDFKTLNKFKQMVEDKRDLRLLLSEPTYQNMRTALEISQACANARP